MPIELPVDFTEKAKLPSSVNGSGYPYRISADDLMRDFYYAALDAEDGWIEEAESGSYQSRKLKLPALPSDQGIFFLVANNGNIEWLQYQEKEVSICEGNYATTGKILFKPS